MDGSTWPSQRAGIFCHLRLASGSLSAVISRDTFIFGRKRLESEASRMNCNVGSFCLLLLMLTGLSGCSSGPSATEPKKAFTAPDKIQGKAQVLNESTVTD